MMLRSVLPFFNYSTGWGSLYGIYSPLRVASRSGTLKFMANLHHPAHGSDLFYPLDNSAVFIASVTGKASPFIYRVSCELDETVYLPDLEAALAETAERFPFFKTELRPGVFWYYLDPLKKPLKLYADTRFPVEYHSLQRWNRYLFRVRVYGSRIACEFHHILTDGTGSLEFLKTLTASYLTRRGVVCDDWQGIKHPSETVDPLEYEDAYASRFRKKIPLPSPEPTAFQLPGPRYRNPVYRVTTGSVSLAEALKIARGKGVSLTALLAAIHLSALQSVCEECRPTDWKPICVQIPVNMRHFYPSRSMRNFFLYITVSIDRRLGHYEFQEILDCVHYTIKLNLQSKELDRQLKRNVRGEENPLSRMVPLIIKNQVLRVIGMLSADKPFSGSLSNLQMVSMPEEFASKIIRFDFLPARKRSTGVNVGVVSWKDTLSITLGSLVVDRSFERYFFSQCASLGFNVTVESNI